MVDQELLSLHGLAVKKAGDADAVAAILGESDAGQVAAALDAHVAAGRAAGANGMFMVAPPGREWLDERYPEAYADFRGDPEASEAYERFEKINRELLALFTDWQMMPAAGGERVPNDHSDADYDAGIVDRLDDAYDKVLAGEHDWVSGARIDSYHTVWFELHEDLLRMLGREREEAP